ncbi:hypothetical protein [Pandoraea sp. PE-S2R-1]|uniref:hypothetical protein n=1 Tax=Pandoraea sp. PE-S2R-1 TaxID=1986994 RepID=UPI0014823F30|nr:hypothetical protein [Pandoraea sp. PE-S2R-1]
MSTKQMPWFRMYTDFLNDPKMITLAFEDQRHFIGLLALKGDGTLDNKCAPDLLNRIVAQRLWVDFAIVGEIKKRLMTVGLIDANWQPAAWDKRQMRSDSSTERVRAHRNKTKQDGNGDETLQKRSGNGLDTDTDTEEEKKKDKTHSRKRGAGVSGGDEVAKPLSEKDLIAEGVDKQHAKDWLTIRKVKRLPLTQTAWDDIKLEADKAGMTPAQAVECAAKAGWAGFKGSWMQNAGADLRATQGGQSAHSGFENRDYGTGGRL